MHRSFVRRFAPFLLLALWPPVCPAEVFTCPGAGGTVVYQQTPCPQPSEPPARPESSPAAPEPAAPPPEPGGRCDLVEPLAFRAARLMQAGMGRTDVRGALGPRAAATVDLVFDHDDPAASAEELSTRAVEACSAGRIPGLDCADLPAGMAAEGCAGAARAFQPPPAMSSDPAVRACREPIEQEIEAIDQKLIAGDRSETPAEYRDRLLQLTAELRACAGQ